MPDSHPETDTTPTPYIRLENRFRRLNALSEAQAVLHWDMSTVMPRGGHEARSEQLAELSAVHHSLLTAPETGDLIAAAQADAANLTDWQHANLREICLLYTSPSPRDRSLSRMPSSA